MRLLLLFLIIITCIKTFAQKNSEWFPSGLNIQPFTANFLEPKAGFSFSLGERNIRLDIGTSTDIFRSQSQNTTYSFGADLFTFTRLRGESEFHFPVEAIDYLFGLNGSIKIKEDDKEYGVRIRLSHISAHFVDGQYDFGKGYWRNNRDPIVYSREFIELFPFYSFNNLRLFAGLTYLINVTPDKLPKGIYQLGFDYFLTHFKELPFTPFIAYDFKLLKIQKYSGNHIVSAGIKFGYYKAKGFSILYSYFAGKSIHGEYYNFNEKYSTLGLNLDL